MAEVEAAHRSTGVPNVVAGIPMSRPAAALIRATAPWAGRVLTRIAGRRSGHADTPPLPLRTATLRSRVWAEVGNVGQSAAAMLEAGEGYRAAAAVAVRAVESLVLTPQVGALTPVQAFGPDFALRVPGTQIQELQ